MKKRIKWLALLAVVCLLLGGCTSMDLRVQTQLVPPGLTGEQADIQAAFESYLETRGDGSAVSYRLQFPATGEHRAAFILQDLDGDKQEEALVFYRTSPESNDVHMNVLCNVDDEWNSVADIAGGSVGVQEIRFGDIFGDGTRAVFVGWSFGSQRESNLRVYRYQNAQITECYRSLYSRLIVSPISRTDREDILLLHLKSRSVGAATLITTEGENFRTLSSTAVDGSVIRYTDTYACINERGDTEIYADGIKETGTITELLVWNGTTLSAPLYKAVQGGTAASFRTGTLSMLDVDKDGLMEWPVLRDTVLGDVGVVDWMRWDAAIGLPVVKCSSYVCSADGYAWLWPAEEWPAETVVSYVPQTKTMTVSASDRTPLFSVSVVEDELTIRMMPDCPLDSRTVRNQLIRLEEE